MKKNKKNTLKMEKLDSFFHDLFLNTLFVLLGMLFISLNVYSQDIGDEMSIKNGNWKVLNKWGDSGYTLVADFNNDGKADIASAHGGDVFMRLVEKMYQTLTPMNSEFFDVVIIRNSTKVLDDRGSGADSQVSVWKPQPPSGFFTFGHLLSKLHYPTEDKKPVTFAVRPKPGYEYLLKVPTFGLHADLLGLQAYKLNCPPGYQALGMVISKNSIPPKPDDENCRCIKENVTVDGRTIALIDPASYASSSDWNDRGSGASGAIGFWKSVIDKKANSAKSVLSLTPNTFFVSNEYNPPSEKPYALNLLFDGDITEKLSPPNPPKLTGPRPLTDEELEGSSQVIEYTLPFFTVIDNMYDSQIEQFLKSPEYLVRRTNYYTLGDGFFNNTSKQQPYTYSLEEGVANERNFNNMLGVAITHTVEASAGADANYVKASVSVQTSFSHSWGGSTVRSRNETSEVVLTIDPGCYGAVYQIMSDYEVLRADGTILGEPLKLYDRGGFVSMEWCPEDLSNK
ncbi:MAG: hypothetical protein DWQ10_17840 [Calditrichaeota bacterium]|nr:MAG: hypothetical protein DWQ10_17840 [Calditrichota bacterium]